MPCEAGHEPHFSVITITYNNITGLKKTHQSLMGQSCKEYEWIVIDGDSQDGTKDYLESISELHFISERDSGIYDAMNKGIDRAKGKYIVFMNAGDCFFDSESLASVIEADGADCIYGDAWEGGAFKRAMPYQYRDTLFTHHQAIYYKRSVIGALRYDLTYPIAADYLFTHLYLKACQSVQYVPKSLCIFEGGGVSQNRSAQGRMELYEIRKKYKIVSLLHNKMIVIKQAIAMVMKRHAAPLYWWVRSRITA